MRHLFRLFLVVLLFAVSAGAHAAGSLSVEFRDRTINISGVSRGGRVVAFGVAREMTNSHPPIKRVVRRADVLLDHDSDGVVHYDFHARGVPAEAMWAFVDVATGASAALPSPGYEPARIDFRGGLAKKDNAGQLRKIEWSLSELELLLVRPGDGAWTLTAAKHSKVDENGKSDQPLRIDVGAMLPLGNSPGAPQNFRPGDIVVVMDPRWMEFGLEEVGK